jgi:hypothetical protein
MLAGNSSLPSSEAKKWQQAFLEAKAQARPKRIQSLVQDEGLTEGHEQLKYYTTNFYKGLFGSPEENSFSLDENQMDDIPQVFSEENGLLTAPYSEEEVKKAIFQMKHNKAPGLDGFPAEFYQSFWDTIKTDLLHMFSVLHTGQLELFLLNFGEVILLPKVNEAERIQQYRFTCLLNVSFKIFMKVATIRLNTVVDHVCSLHKLLSCKDRISLMGLSSYVKQFMNCILRN